MSAYIFVLVRPNATVTGGFMPDLRWNPQPFYGQPCHFGTFFFISWDEKTYKWKNIQIRWNLKSFFCLQVTSQKVLNWWKDPDNWCNDPKLQFEQLRKSIWCGINYCHIGKAIQYEFTGNKHLLSFFYIPRFAQWRDLSHSYVHWVERNIPHRSKKQHNLPVQ